MLKTVAITANRKTGPIAVTYRSGTHETYGTCPKSCSLHPKSETGADQIDQEYMEALLNAVPRQGIAWTYSHFPAASLPIAGKNQTVINASCDTEAEAVEAIRLGRPAVLATPTDTADTFPKTVEGIRFYRCPAELADNFTCAQCGNGSPICARSDRRDVVVFVAHGTGAKKVGTGKGGCYAASGPTAIQWHGTKKAGTVNDAIAVKAFAKSLPPGSLLRHHVAGDTGREVAAC